MSEGAHKVLEVRIPVPTAFRVLTQADWERGDWPRFEYIVLEQWSDFTMRHPTTGNVVAMEVWQKDPAAALRFLRTGERHVHYIRTGEWT